MDGRSTGSAFPVTAGTADMVVADLHVHTQTSDGTLTVDAVPAAARRAGVDVVALTDHDRLTPDLGAPVTDRDGVTIVHGIELRVAATDRRVDLLGYGVEPTPELETLLAEIQADRRDRGRAIIESVEDRLGVDLGLEPHDGLGRPHIARAIDASAADYDYQAAFDHLIGNGCPCYVSREIPSFERGRRVLAEACSLVGLAHPFRYDDPAAALALTADLDAVERYYPYDRAVDPAPIERAMADHDLLATGGSDAHDDTLGRAGLDEADCREFCAALER